ncbi:hypothetical protein K488DRAFT_78147 [Vararia minispora EC-137]|uniref:Uncharacterized protein n=1 Tax=Vararia minispora EC-137 TaxID=1314806 RepID=A0ACB8QMY5_9AGAM|nr:hypothetical protein K488DRAFT_78147 [Vararia minispora EC-137]
MQHQSQSLATIQLPRTLARPNRHEVSRDNITAIEPNLAGASLEYVRNKLRDRGDEFARMVSSVHVPQTLQRAQIPQEQYITVHATSASASSLHLLAVFSSKVSAQDPMPQPSDTAYIFPTHMLNLAIDCAQLPRLTRMPALLRADGTVDLPVVQLNVPHAEAFAPLHAYLLTHRIDRFLGMLIPVSPSLLSPARGSSASAGAGPLAHINPQQLAVAVVQTAAGDRRAALMSLVHSIKAVWRNTCSLGIFDRELWAALDIAWETVLTALHLHIAAGGQ